MKPSLNYLYLSPLGRKLTHRWGPAVWRLPSIVRRHMRAESQIPRLRSVRVWRYGTAERVKPQPLTSATPPTFGHRLASRPYRLAQPFVAEFERAWLVGKYATPVTPRGDMLLTAFRDQPRIMGLEEHPDLLAWMEAQKWQETKPSADMQHVCSFVNRLETNYFHWMTEWCGQVEGLLHYHAQTGILPKLIVRANGPAYMQESLKLLGFDADALVPWQDDSPAAFVENCVVSSIPGNRVACSPRSLHWLRNKFLTAVGVDQNNLNADRKIYISRKKGGWRSIVNDDEVVDFMEQAGFQILAAEKLSFTDQIKLFSEAKMIVGLHGSGLTNVLFAPKTSVLELVGSYGDGVFYSIAASLGQRYVSLECQPQGDDVLVDTQALMRAISSLESQQSSTKNNLLFSPQPSAGIALNKSMKP